MVNKTEMEARELFKPRILATWEDDADGEGFPMFYDGIDEFPSDVEDGTLVAVYILQGFKHLRKPPPVLK